MSVEPPTGKTALITGASSGIGAAFARALSGQGYRLILVARREDRLRSLAAQLPETCEVFAADLSTSTGIEQVEKRIAEASPLAMLVNNAGFGTWGTFEQVEAERHIAMIEVHVLATVRLTHAALPAMIRQRSGAIINVSSIAAFMPTPGNVTYCATKAYLNSFSTSLQFEVQRSGIQVQALCPGFTISEFHDQPDFSRKNVRAQVPKALWMSPDEVVAASLRALAHGKNICIPGFKNRLIVALGRAGLSRLLFQRLSRRFRTE